LSRSAQGDQHGNDGQNSPDLFSRQAVLHEIATRTGLARNSIRKRIPEAAQAVYQRRVVFKTAPFIHTLGAETGAES
jgi:hypothetical protein